MNVMKLTPNEIALLQGSRTNEFEDAFEGGTPWVYAVIAASGLDPTVARGVISSLVQKQIVVISDYEGRGRSEDMTFCLTDLGQQVEMETLEGVPYDR